jgi:predicted ABC-type ATPase
VSDPRLVIVGGPNGAGKTTLSRQLVKDWGLLYLGADEVAAEMGLGSTGGDAVRAGRLFLARIEEAARARHSVLVESTLSGLGTTRLIRRFHQAGYLISAQSVFVSSADECVARILGRVLKGGHHVPEADVRRRFRRSLTNFWTRYRFEADRWRLYYNGAVGPTLVTYGEGQEALVVDPLRFEQFLGLMEA